MSPTPADADLLPPRRVLRALDIPTPTYSTMKQRGLLAGLLGAPDASGYSRFTLQGALALAAFRAFTELRMEPPRELRSPAAFVQYASLWLRTRGTDKPVRE